MKAVEMIGRRIAEVYSRRVYVEEYGCTSQEIFLQLDGATVVSMPNEEEDPQIIDHTSEMVVYEANERCAGQTIVDVLASECLPNYVLVLSNGQVLFGTSHAPSEFSWYIDDDSDGFRERYDCVSLRDAKR